MPRALQRGCDVDPGAIQDADAALGDPAGLPWRSRWRGALHRARGPRKVGDGTVENAHPQATPSAQGPGPCWLPSASQHAESGRNAQKV